MNKKEIRYLDPESNYNNSTNKLINNSFLTNYEEEGLKAIQRSIALLRQNIRIIVREELTAALNGGIQG